MTDLGEKKYHVFLSYSHADAEVVEKLAVRLEDEAGLKVWLDQWVLIPGQPFQQGMGKGLDEAGACAVCIGSKEHAGWFSKEIQKALNRQAQEEKFGVIPVLLAGGDPALLKNFDFLDLNTWVDFKDGMDDAEAFRRLVAGIKVESPGRPKSAGKTPMKRVFAVPVGRNPLFTGRGQELQELEARLKTNGVAALTGLGGVGKTQTAVEYCYRHRDEYEAVLWTGAETAASLEASLAKLAERLGLPVQATKVNDTDALGWVKRWLDDHASWLLVLDNVDDQTAISEVVKRASPEGPHVIVTTQAQATGIIEGSELEGMDLQQGALLLLRRARRLASNAPMASAPPQDTEWARKIADEVGGLPLALEQAGAYLQETRSSLEDYLKLVQERVAELLGSGAVAGIDHPGVMATVTTSLDKLGKKDAAAVELVNVLAFLAPDGTAEEIFTSGAGEFAEGLKQAAADTLQWNKTIGAALSFSLVKRDPEKKRLGVHRMVQAVARAQMKKEERGQRVEQALRALKKVIPKVEYVNWEPWERLVPSAKMCARWVKELKLSPAEAAEVLSSAGLYLDERTRYAEAEPLLRQALEIGEKNFGPEASIVARALVNLGIVLRDRGQVKDAEELMRRALKIDEKTCAANDPEMAGDLNTLAKLLKATRPQEAEPLYRQALDIRKAALKADDPDIATSLNDLGLFLSETGRHAEAEPMMRDALDIYRRALGEWHPYVATPLNNLAVLLEETGRKDDAEPLYRKALEIGERSLGPEHPRIAIRLSNLAKLLLETQRYEEAETKYRRALEIDTNFYGTGHPEVKADLRSLAALLEETGRKDEAEMLRGRIGE